MLFVVTLLLFVSVDATHQTSFIGQPCVSRGHALLRTTGQASQMPLALRMEAPNLGDVVIKPCKTLCKGCVPYICERAPLQSEEDMQKVELSQQRMVEKERELDLERERMEAIAAGVVQIDSRQHFEETCTSDATHTLMVIFWGGRWCRKCTALRPEFVKLAAEMNDKHGDKILFAYCDAKAIAKATDLPPSAILKNLAGVSIVPTLQCWRKGQVIDEYITGKDRAAVIPAARQMIANHV